MMNIKAQDTLVGVQARKWIVGSLQETGHMSISSTPVIHDSAQLAEVECERLAKQNPGTAYISLQFRAGRLVPKVTNIQSF
jgi:hypothetical protein